jgi:2-C-methyl-D-erythritol 2,4-cyclodiphosphate synthase
MKGLPRIGFGYDVHRLEEGRTLTIGGVVVSRSIGAVAHSDGDVLAHAICDALLGAAALGDIGAHFPDTDERYRGISSMVLLRLVMNLLREHRFRVGNIDATVILQAPKIMPFADRMRATIAEAIGCTSDSISIKATTAERLDAIGQGLGIAAHAVALIAQTDEAS